MFVQVFCNQGRGFLKKVSIEIFFYVETEKWRIFEMNPITVPFIQKALNKEQKMEERYLIFFCK